MKIFDILDALTIDKSDLDFNDVEIKKIYNQFMINRFLSMCETLIPHVEQVSVMSLNDERHYEYLKSILPKRKFYYKFIKGDKDLNAEQKRYIADYFEVGLNDVEGFILNMDNDEIEMILSKYTYGKNERIII